MTGPNYDDEFTNLEAHFRAGWLAAGSPTTVEYANEPFTPPDPASGDAWVRFMDDPQAGERASIDPEDPLFRFFGLLIIEVLVPLDLGTGLAGRLADQAGALFMGSAAPSGFDFLNPPRAQVVGKTDGAWWKVNVLIPYQRDEIIS